MIAGEVDSFEGGPQGVFAADAKGADAKILGCHWVVVPTASPHAHNINRVPHLKGKPIAASAPNLDARICWRFALAKYGAPDSAM